MGAPGKEDRMQTIVRVTVVSLVVVGAAASASAMWKGPDEHVPLDRLIANTARRVEASPDDGRAHGLLARLHGLAWAGIRGEVGVESPEEEGGLPSIPIYQPVVRKRSAPTIADADVEHFQQAVFHYRKATRLLPDVALYWLGLGHLLDTGSSYVGRIGSPDGVEAKLALAPERQERLGSLLHDLAAGDAKRREAAARGLREGLEDWGAVLPQFLDGLQGEPREALVGVIAHDWRRHAVAAYTRAFELAREGDLAGDALPSSGPDVISEEAGAALKRLLPEMPQSEARDELLASVKKALGKLGAKPRFITPVIFPLGDDRPLSALVDDDRTVAFDLDGDDVPGLWPWLRPGAGILVWDPEAAGRITSGRRLFGSVTWWMFWADGYEPLAALDDDGDGRLTGSELDGIAVWRDRDADAVSDPGEVVPARAMGVVSIAVGATARSEGVPANPRGIELADGTTRPTYDWTPERRDLRP